MPIEMTASPPPRTKRSAKSTTISIADTSVKSRTEARAEGIMDIAGVGAMVLSIFGLHLDAAAVMIHGGNIAEAAAKTGETDERMGAVLDRISATGPYVALFAAFTPLIGQIAVNHKLLKVEQVGGGVMAPEVLMANFRAQQAEAQRLATERQMEAERAYLQSQLRLKQFHEEVANLQAQIDETVDA